jgi:hypothetical protein
MMQFNISTSMISINLNTNGTWHFSQKALVLFFGFIHGKPLAGQGCGCTGI